MASEYTPDQVAGNHSRSSVADEATIAAIIYESVLRGTDAETAPLEAAYPFAASLARAKASQATAACHICFLSYAYTSPLCAASAVTRLSRVNVWSLAQRCGRLTALGVRLGMLLLVIFVTYRVGFVCWKHDGPVLKEVSISLCRDGLGHWIETLCSLLAAGERSLVPAYLLDELHAIERGPLFWAGAVAVSLVACVIAVKVARMTGTAAGFVLALAVNIFLWASGGIECDVKEDVACECCSAGATSAKANPVPT
jgi:hypothetical protein